MSQFSSLYPISFILPIYNVERYLAEAIESVLRQTIEKEIILVDDGSSDRSLEIALDYARRYPFISVIYASNRGVSSARNKGLAQARGEYVLFLDPDDILDQNADLLNAYRLAKDYQIDVVKGQFLSYSMGNPAHTYPKQPTFTNVVGDQAAIAPLTDFLQLAPTRDWFIQIACFMFKRELLTKNQISFDERLHFSEEGLFFADVFCCEGKILELSSLFVHYRMRLNSAMSSNVINSQHTDRRITSLTQAVYLLQERVEKQDNPSVRAALELIQALNCYFLQHAISELPEGEIKMRYQHHLTPEMVALYRAKGVGFHQTAS